MPEEYGRNAQARDIKAIAKGGMVGILGRILAQCCLVVSAALLARTLGVRIALDDFGAGADRMSAIIDMKPSILKLDYNLIQRIHEKRIAALVKAFADFCKTEGISILAEGVEKEDQAGKCAELGIQLGQGDLYGKAAPL